MAITSPTDPRAVSVSIAAVAFILWDWCISIPDEVELIWRPNLRGWIRWVYVFVRYFPLVLELAVLAFAHNIGTSTESVTTTTCKGLFFAQLVILLLLNLAVELVLTVRVHALYRDIRSVRYVLAVLFLADVLLSFTVGILGVNQVQVGDSCTVLGTPRLLGISWLMPLLYETILFGMTVYSWWDSGRRAQSDAPRVLRALLRDGSWAYTILFAFMILNAVAYLDFPPATKAIFYYISASALSFTGSHLILNLRRLALGLDTLRSADTYELSTAIFPTRGPLSSSEGGTDTTRDTVV